MAVTLTKAECAFCRGTGVVAKISKCPICNGRRVVYVQEPFVPCPECEGRGVKHGTQLSCLKCRGKGVVHQAEPTTEYAEWAGPTTKYSQWNASGEGAWRS